VEERGRGGGEVKEGEEGRGN